MTVFSLQEMETANVAYARYDPRKENAWVDAILEALGPNAEDYCKVQQGFVSPPQDIA